MSSATTQPSESVIVRTLLRLAEERGDRRTFCPSEAARALSDDWRPLMPRIRTVAGKLVADGKLRCTQRGSPADPETAHGPIRLGR